MFEAIISSVIVAAIVAGGGAYVNGRVMEVRINGLREAVKGLQESVKAMPAIIETNRILEREMEAVRKRLHEWGPHIGWVDQERRKGND